MIEKNQYWRAFGKLFFILHQEKLLWLLNHYVFGKWFRRVLKINGSRSSVGNAKITKILPNAIFWRKGNQHVAEFRMHDKFSKRLYYAFKSAWWTMHGWDYLIADRLVPRLSFGFATLTRYPDPNTETSSVDGYAAHSYGAGSGVSWATLMADAGNLSNDTSADEGLVYIQADTTSGQWRDNRRAIFLFDTSALGADATITAAVLSLNNSGNADTPGWAPNSDIYTSNPASNTAVASGDYDSLGSTSQTGGNPCAYASWSYQNYHDFTLDSTGIGNIAKTGISKFGSRNANYDVAGTSPTWGSGGSCYVGIYWADQTGTTQDPKLVVTYTAIEGSLVGSLTASFDNTANPTTVNHTPGAAAKGIVVGIVLEGTATRTGGAPSIGGSSMTQADSTRGGTAGYETSAELWYLLGDYDGSQITVSIPNSGSDTLHIYVQAFTAPSGYDLEWVDDDGYESSSSNGSTLTLIHGVSGSIAFAVCGDGELNVSSTSEQNDTVELDISDQGSSTSCFGYAVASSTANLSLGWAWSNDDGEIVGTCFKLTAVVATGARSMIAGFLP